MAPDESEEEGSYIRRGVPDRLIQGEVGVEDHVEH